MRIYKEDSPSNTINRIRQILHSIGMLPIEQSWYNPVCGLYSVRLENTRDKGGFGASGKGRNHFFALASAYSEFIERLQNGFIAGSDGLNRLFIKQINKKFGFHYYPDEKILSQKEFLTLPSDYLNDIFGDASEEEIHRFIKRYFHHLDETGQKGVVSVPFYDCNRRKITYLPYNLTFILTGSNGMAAGNTAGESIFQALCELVERYSARTVFFDKLTPPAIPEEILSGYTEEYSIISNLRKSGYEVMIKDFSCGIGLPAVGIILIDRKNNKYRLNIGADTSLQFALSRGLTEIFQGIGNDSAMKRNMLDIPIQFPDYFIDDTPQSQIRKEKEIRNFIINGLGVFPPSLFGQKESYSFSEKTFLSHDSYKDEVRYLISLFSSLGHSVFIRNVSFLGFPSYYVYIPGVSVWGRKTNRDTPTIQTIERSFEHDRIEDVFFPSTSILSDPERIRKLLDFFAPNREVRYTGLSLYRVLKVDLASEKYSDIPANFFITLLCYANKEYENAQKFLKEFMSESHTEDNEYYNTVLSFFKDLENGISPSESESKYGSGFLSDFSSLERLFAYVPFPTCPDCSSCPFDVCCSTKANFNNMMRIAQRMGENEPLEQIEIEDFTKL